MLGLFQASGIAFLLSQILNLCQQLAVLPLQSFMLVVFFDECFRLQVGLLSKRLALIFD
jgi:hypothetical protein